MSEHLDTEALGGDTPQCTLAPPQRRQGISGRRPARAGTPAAASGKDDINTGPAGLGTRKTLA
jgi:hypothetical protein